MQRMLILYELDELTEKKESMSYFPLIVLFQDYLCMSALLSPEFMQSVLLLLPVVSTVSLCSSGEVLFSASGGVVHVFS
jgi:hypothetical protein